MTAKEKDGGGANHPVPRLAKPQQGDPTDMTPAELMVWTDKLRSVSRHMTFGRPEQARGELRTILDDLDAEVTEYMTAMEREDTASITLALDREFAATSPAWSSFRVSA